MQVIITYDITPNGPITDHYVERCIRAHLRRVADVHAPHFDAEFRTVEVVATPDSPRQIIGMTSREGINGPLPVWSDDEVTS